MRSNETRPLSPAKYNISKKEFLASFCSFSFFLGSCSLKKVCYRLYLPTFPISLSLFASLKQEAIKHGISKQSWLFLSFFLKNIKVALKIVVPLLKYQASDWRQDVQTNIYLWANQIRTEHFAIITFSITKEVKWLEALVLLVLLHTCARFRTDRPINSKWKLLYL